jgi:sortase (surface protein transpeptidase)
VRLQIPAIDLDVPVAPMGWQVIVTDAGKRTDWVVPDAAAGWHVNSAGVGGEGNVVLSGHQVAGSAVFAPLSLGDVQVGQDVLLTDGAGTTFVYRITQVTEPMPVAGASEEEQALAASYIGPTDTPRLTLVTGWPDFTTTHRIFALADLVGAAQ